MPETKWACELCGKMFDEREDAGTCEDEHQSVINIYQEEKAVTVDSFKKGTDVPDRIHVGNREYRLVEKRKAKTAK